MKSRICLSYRYGFYIYKAVSVYQAKDPLSDRWSWEPTLHIFCFILNWACSAMYVWDDNTDNWPKRFNNT